MLFDRIGRQLDQSHQNHQPGDAQQCDADAKLAEMRGDAREEQGGGEDDGRQHIFVALLVGGPGAIGSRFRILFQFDGPIRKLRSVLRQNERRTRCRRILPWPAGQPSFEGRSEFGPKPLLEEYRPFFVAVLVGIELLDKKLQINGPVKIGEGCGAERLHPQRGGRVVAG